jgi:hypothetical protein
MNPIWTWIWVGSVPQGPTLRWVRLSWAPRVQIWAESGQVDQVHLAALLSTCCLSYWNGLNYITHHHKPQLEYFLPHFSVGFIIKVSNQERVIVANAKIQQQLYFWLCIIHFIFVQTCYEGNHCSKWRLIQKTDTGVECQFFWIRR